MRKRSSYGPEFNLIKPRTAYRNGFADCDIRVRLLVQRPFRRELLAMFVFAVLVPTQIACGGGSSQMSSSGGPGGDTVHQYATGKGPTWVAAGDFNGDKKLDLVVTNGTDNTLSVLLGNGDGTFQKKVDYPADTSLWAVAVADFNGDSKQDLVVASSSDGLLLGNGDGMFRAMVPLSTGMAHDYAVAVGDLNGDGKPDLVFVDGYTGGVLLGNGDGTFLPGADPGWDELYPFSVAMGDFNADGKLDVVLSGDNHGSGWVIPVAGNGDGTLAYVTKLYEVVGIELGSGVALSDFNGDGKQDIVTGSGASAILSGNGDGTFQAPTEFATAAGIPMALAVADFNSDGKPDLAIVNGKYLDGSSGSNTVSILLGNGDGTFQTHVDYPTGTSPTSVVVGDFNGDGILDLAVTNQDDNTVSILLGNGDGTFKNKW